MGSAIVGIIGILLPTLLRIIGLWIDKSIQDKDKKEKAIKSYLQFVSDMEPSLDDSLEMRKKISGQKERLEKLLAERNSQNPIK